MDLCSFKRLAEERGPITWVGAVRGGVGARLSNEKSVTMVDVRRGQFSSAETKVVYNNESDKKTADTGEVSPRQYSGIRLASVLGLNVCGTCEPGGFQKYKAVEGSCTASYDIEVDISTNAAGEFPLVDNNILSIACSCTCGLKIVFLTIDAGGVTSIGETKVVQCSSSGEAVRCFTEAMRIHMPLWLIGWNNYGFDNQCMLYHDLEMSHMYEQVRVGSSKMVSYGSVLHIPGCYNIDAMVYMSRARPGQYSAMSLKVVSQETGCAPKLDMPVMSRDVDLESLVTYNINDCDVALEVWFKSGLCTEIPALAACSSSPVYDCARYVTGTMVPLLISSVALSKGMVINWSTSEREQEYKGGYVLDPKRGHHRNVVVCDYSSMYPTIMSCCNISPETVTVGDLREGDYPDKITWDSQHIRVVLDDRAALFPYKGTSLLKESLKEMVQLRKASRRSDPLYAASLKVCANSAYGCVGYEESAMYSPSCSASVTAIGRWCVKLAYRVLERHGLSILYGDTDSCFVSPSNAADMTEDGARRRVSAALDSLKKEFEDTPLQGMTMEMESYHPGVILLDKKRYCKLNEDGSIKYTGVSAARRNTAGLVRETCINVCESILNYPTVEQQVNSISRHLEVVLLQVMSGSVTVKDVSSIASRDGIKCYAYESTTGQAVRRALWESHLDASDVAAKGVLKSVREECNRITVPCGLGDTAEICRRSTRFVD